MILDIWIQSKKKIFKTKHLHPIKHLSLNWVSALNLVLMVNDTNEHIAQHLFQSFPEFQMNDPMKWWEQFVNNMVPVIKRIVMFSKKLPGE